MRKDGNFGNLVFGCFWNATGPRLKNSLVLFGFQLKLTTGNRQKVFGRCSQTSVGHSSLQDMRSAAAAKVLLDELHQHLLFQWSHGTFHMFTVLSSFAHATCNWHPGSAPLIPIKAFILCMNWLSFMYLLALHEVTPRKNSDQTSSQADKQTNKQTNKQRKQKKRKENTRKKERKKERKKMYRNKQTNEWILPWPSAVWSRTHPSKGHSLTRGFLAAAMVREFASNCPANSKRMESAIEHKADQGIQTLLVGSSSQLRV